MLGAHLLTPGDTDDAPVHLGSGEAGLATAARRLEKLWRQLFKLHKAGLARQAAAALLKVYAGPASQYNLQLDNATDAETEAYDNQLCGYWETLAERPLAGEARTLLGLPVKLGGCGAQLAATRRHAAY